jgi:uncharacterized protein YecE (DUF72 family)
VQTSLFDTRPAGFDFASLERIPPSIRFGTSSWTYPGWRGTVYREAYRSDKDLRERCLEEYGRWPAFSCVGVDSTFYAPPEPAVLLRWARQLPARVRWVCKTWDRLTVSRYARHPRYGARAGTENPEQLDPGVFFDVFLRPFDEAGVRDRLGPFMLEFQPMSASERREPRRFLDKLGAFCAAVGREVELAVEIRTPELLGADYFSVLRAHGVAHVLNHWSRMPAIRRQRELASASGGLPGRSRVLRLLTPRGLTYEESVDAFQPYDRLREPIADMREDAVEAALEALEVQVPAYVLVNNRLEGHAPSTIDALIQVLAQRLASAGALP